METHIITFDGITKMFPGVKALDQISFTARSGRITGLIGVNGAGKSTLMNIIGGMFPPTEGRILLDGKELRFHSPQDAERCGIGFIHQEPVMFNSLSVAENICISRLKGTVHYGNIRAEAKKYLDMMGCSIDPRAKVGDLPIGERQMVEIARALSAGGRVLLFDEPTASFSDKEKERLFEVMRTLRDNGSIVFFISHFLDEIEEITDDLVVLRDGRKVLEGETAAITREQILENMISGQVQHLNQDSWASDRVVLEVQDLTAGKAPQQVSFRLRAGEIVGLWGLMGSGRTELLRTLYGLEKLESGTIRYAPSGAELREVSPVQLREHCGFVTEARHDDGIFLPWTIWENISAPNLRRFLKKKSCFLNDKAQKQEAETYLKRLNIKAPNINVRLENLSGGNQQKVIMAKWLMRAPDVFLLDEPTRGVDVGAKAEIHRLIQDLARQGTAVLLVSSEIEEISLLSDRVLVLNHGRITAEVSKDQIDKQTLMANCV